MADDPSETLYTLVIAGVKDETTKAKVTRTLVRITKNLPASKIEARLNALPWTLTRRAPLKKAYTLVELLEKQGAEIKVFPPLPAPVLRDVEGTQILPETKLLSETQVMSSTQFIEMPEQLASSSAPPPPMKPPPDTGTQTGGNNGWDSGIVDIEPLTLGGILDRTFQICRSNFWKLLAVVAIPWLVTAAIAIASAVLVGVVGLTWRSLGGLPLWILIVAGVALIPSIAVVMIGFMYLAQGAMIHAVSSVYLGRQIMIKEAYRFVLGRLGRFFFTSCLFVISAVGLTVFPILMGVLLFYLFQELTSSGWWSALTWLPLSLIPLYGITKLLLWDKVVIIENGAYIGALKRSWGLLSGKADSPWPRGYFLRLVILLNIFMLVYLAIHLLFRTPALLIALLIPEPRFLGTVVEQFLTSASSLVAGIFGSVGMVVFYYDIRNRKEGFDLKMLSEMD